MLRERLDEECRTGHYKGQSYNLSVDPSESHASAGVILLLNRSATALLLTERRAFFTFINIKKLLA
jgi:hypothetical protein